MHCAPINLIFSPIFLLFHILLNESIADNRVSICQYFDEFVRNRPLNYHFCHRWWHSQALLFFGFFVCLLQVDNFMICRFSSLSQQILVVEIISLCVKCRAHYCAIPFLLLPRSPLLLLLSDAFLLWKELLVLIATLASALLAAVIVGLVALQCRVTVDAEQALTSLQLFLLGDLLHSLLLQFLLLELITNTTNRWWWQSVVLCDFSVWSDPIILIHSLLPNRLQIWFEFISSRYNDRSETYAPGWRRLRPGETPTVELAIILAWLSYCFFVSSFAC